MIGRRWTRLAAMSPREIAGRSAMDLRVRVDRLAWVLRRPRWSRHALAATLDPAIPAMRHASSLLAARDDAGAHRVLSAHFAWRPPLFVLTPHARDNIARLIRARFPSAAADAERRGNRAVEGRLDLLGYHGLDVSAGPLLDWHRDPVHDRRAPLRHWSEIPYLDPSVGDHKIVWELNRHQHWMTLGRAYWLTGHRRYRTAFVEQLGSWMRANPPRTGINWASMLELSLRSLSWIWALHLFVEGSEPHASGSDPAPPEPPWTVDLLLGIDAQLALVERHLSTYFSPNTHLLGEALALYVAGRALPELRAAGRWARVGRTILRDEATRQINADGGHAELSTHYHRYTLDFYLLALAVAQVSNDSEMIAPFGDAVRRLAGFARSLSDHRFHLPQIGDDDGGMLFALCGREPRDVGAALSLAAALVGEPELSDAQPHEDLLWMTGTAQDTATSLVRRQSVWLPDSGYVVSRTPRGDHLVMDVGRLGYLNAGHAHADALSLTLNVAGRPLFIDPGTGSYTMRPDVRDRLRSTAAHNTITLDGRWQSEPAGPFHWRSRAAARLEASRFTSESDFIEASHDGYGPGGHLRQVLARAGCWIVVDWVGGASERRIAAHWHLDPAWQACECGTSRIGLRHPDGTVVWMLTSGGAIETSTGASDGLGWQAPSYGPLRPTTTIRVAVAASTPFALVTAIVESDRPPTLRLLTSAPASGPSADPTAFQIAGPGWLDTVVAAGPGTSPVSGLTHGVPGEGRFLFARTEVVRNPVHPPARPAVAESR